MICLVALGIVAMSIDELKLPSFPQGSDLSIMISSHVYE